MQRSPSLDTTRVPELAAARDLSSREGREEMDALSLSIPAAERVAALEQERARLLQELEAARASATHAEQHVEAVLATVSHELRTPLQALNVGVHLIVTRVRGSVDETPRDWLLGRLDKVHKSSVRLTHLVSTLLDASQIHAGHLEVHPEELDLSALVGEMVDGARDELGWAGCACTFSGTGVAAGRWDRMRLEVVVSNLLSNAMKYGAGHPIHVEVEGREASVLLSVRDEGIGIALEDQARIFERFERARTTSNLTGFGLGLWITRRIVEAMGGTIGVKSAPGEGATFEVTLPRSPTAPFEQPARSE
jgi:signal transduction histidine kinase